MEPGLKYTYQSTNDNRLSRTGVLENYFSPYRDNTIGGEQCFESPYGKKEIIYADWTASGRAYQPIEECIQKEILPFIANTHTTASVTGSLMSAAYEEAKLIIKMHVHAGSGDVLIFCGSGMTGAVNKLQRILGLRMPEQLMGYLVKESQQDNRLDDSIGINKILGQVDEMLKPVVFITHMEHHSNHTSWLETIATVEIINPDKNGNVDLTHLRQLLEQFKHRKNKIAAVTACSNVTGIETPYHEISKLLHEYGGLCFVDFACSAPYVEMNMHPEEKGAQLDAVYFSPHKFLGGPGTPGVLIFNKMMYKNLIPDQPGGGTLLYSNPWKIHEYITGIEQREDGGTPPILQGIKAAMCIRLKEAMGVKNILKREAEIMNIIFERMSGITNLEILQGNIKGRLGIISFVVRGAHYNLIARLLNDRFGIQARGGCSCAGTYGHSLLHIDKKSSQEILTSIRSGDLFCKPGWTRLSVHPAMSNATIDFIMDAVELTASFFKEWAEDYAYDPVSNEYLFAGEKGGDKSKIEGWFNVRMWSNSFTC